jgi:K+:H+ antiporter
VSRRWMLALVANILVCLVPAIGFAAETRSHGPCEVIFLAQIIARLVCGRLSGRVDAAHWPVGGDGPADCWDSARPFGAGRSLARGFSISCFRRARNKRPMIDAVAQLGILLLLLLTGMETDLQVVRRSRRAAFGVSIAGIALPFLPAALSESTRCSAPLSRASSLGSRRSNKERSNKEIEPQRKRRGGGLARLRSSPT